MRPSDLRSAAVAGPLLAGASGVLLLAALPLTWYRPVERPSVGAPAPAQSALGAFSVLDILLVLLALTGVALLAAGVARRRLRPVSAVVGCLAVVAVIALTVRLLDPPAGAETVRLGPAAYLALLAVVGIVLGAALPWCRAWLGGDDGPMGRAPARGRWLALGLLGLVAIYLASRISFIDRFPYFFDEGLYGNYAYQGANDLSRLFVSFTIGREPLPIWLAIPFVKLGFNPLDAVRLVGLFCGLATVFVIGLLARRLYGNVAGVVAGALCVVLPAFVVNDGIGVTEPVLILVVSAALLLQIELARRPRLRVALLLAAVFFLAWLTKESAKPALALLPLSLLCFDWSPDGRRERLVAWGKGVAVVVLGVVCAELLMRLSSMYPALQAARATPFYPVRTVREALAQPGVGWELAWPVFRPALSGYVTVPLLAATLAGAVLGLVRPPERRRTLLLLAWIALPFTISVLFTNLPFPRHILYLLPPAIPLMAHGLQEGGRLVARLLPVRAAAVATGVLAALLLVPALRLDAEVLADPVDAPYPSRDGRQYITASGAGAVWPSVAESIRRRGKGAPVVVLTPSAQRSVLQFILGPTSRYELVKGSSPLAPGAQLAVYDQNTGPLVDQAGHREAQRRGFVPLEYFERPRNGTVVTLFGPSPRQPAVSLEGGSIRSSEGGSLRIVPGAVSGVVEEQRAEGGKVRIRGWAANLRRRRVARYVLVFSGDRFVAVVPPTVARVDLRRRTGVEALQNAGFAADLPLRGPGRGDRLEVFAVDGRVASRLPPRRR